MERSSTRSGRARWIGIASVAVEAQIATSTTSETKRIGNPIRIGRHPIRTAAEGLEQHRSGDDPGSPRWVFLLVRAKSFSVQVDHQRTTNDL